MLLKCFKPKSHPLYLNRFEYEIWTGATRRLEFMSTIGIQVPVTKGNMHNIRHVRLLPVIVYTRRDISIQPWILGWVCDPVLYHSQTRSLHNLLSSNASKTITPVYLRLVIDTALEMASFFGLPRELRDIVYGYVLETATYDCPHFIFPAKQTGPESRDYLALWRTCKTLFMERPDIRPMLRDGRLIPVLEISSRRQRANWEMLLQDLTPYLVHSHYFCVLGPKKKRLVVSDPFIINSRRTSLDSTGVGNTGEAVDVSLDITYYSAAEVRSIWRRWTLEWRDSAVAKTAMKTWLSKPSTNRRPTPMCMCIRPKPLPSAPYVSPMENRVPSEAVRPFERPPPDTRKQLIVITPETCHWILGAPVPMRPHDCEHWRATCPNLHFLYAAFKPALLERLKPIRAFYESYRYGEKFLDQHHDECSVLQEELDCLRRCYPHYNRLDHDNSMRIDCTQDDGLALMPADEQPIFCGARGSYYY